MTKRDMLLSELKDEADAIDRNEAYKAKRTYEKKPKAIRRYERLSKMDQEGDSKPFERKSR